ncbi:hypothetical protein ABT115_21860 [Streptomyces sp. NPDC001832]|uniref:hypothetical protein n=1 Tax=Streptomyces sp. NPDC001832 TaxID=3154527 RepID=UPI003330C026
MAEDGGTYKISSEFLESFARDRINGQFVEEFRNDEHLLKLYGYGGMKGAGTYDTLRAGNPDVKEIGAAKALEDRFTKFATDMVGILDGLKEGMLVLSDKVLNVNHITQQGEQDAKDIALQSMMDDLKEPLAMFSGSGGKSNTTTESTSDNLTQNKDS